MMVLTLDATIRGNRTVHKKKDSTTHIYVKKLVYKINKLSMYIFVQNLVTIYH